VGYLGKGFGSFQHCAGGESRGGAVKEWSNPISKPRAQPISAFENAVLQRKIDFAPAERTAPRPTPWHTLRPTSAPPWRAHGLDRTKPNRTTKNDTKFMKCPDISHSPEGWKDISPG